MKTKLLQTVLFICLLYPSLSSAQFFEAGVGGGFNTHNVVTDVHVIGNRGGLSAAANAGIIIFPTYTVGLMYMQNKWGYTTYHGNVDLATPARNYSVYLTKHFKLPNYTYHSWHSDLSIRVYAGLTYVNKGSMIIDQINYYYHNNFVGNGRNIGMQLEYSHPIYKMLNIFGNIGIGGAFMEGVQKYWFYSYNGKLVEKKYRYNIMYYTSEIGIGLKI